MKRIMMILLVFVLSFLSTLPSLAEEGEPEQQFILIEDDEYEQEPSAEEDDGEVEVPMEDEAQNEVEDEVQNEVENEVEEDEPEQRSIWTVKSVFFYRVTRSAPVSEIPETLSNIAAHFDIVKINVENENGLSDFLDVPLLWYLDDIPTTAGSYSFFADVIIPVGWLFSPYAPQQVSVTCEFYDDGSIRPKELEYFEVDFDLNECYILRLGDEASLLQLIERLQKELPHVRAYTEDYSEWVDLVFESIDTFLDMETPDIYEIYFNYVLAPDDEESYILYNDMYQVEVSVCVYNPLYFTIMYNNASDDTVTIKISEPLRPDKGTPVLEYVFDPEGMLLQKDLPQANWQPLPEGQVRYGSDYITFSRSFLTLYGDYYFRLRANGKNSNIVRLYESGDKISFTYIGDLASGDRDGGDGDGDNPPDINQKPPIIEDEAGEEEEQEQEQEEEQEREEGGEQDNEDDTTSPETDKEIIPPNEEQVVPDNYDQSLRQPLVVQTFTVQPRIVQEPIDSSTQNSSPPVQEQLKLNNTEQMIIQPKIVWPEIVQSETVPHETVQPQTAQQDAVQSEIVQPEEARHETIQPDTDEKPQVVMESLEDQPQNISVNTMPTEQQEPSKTNVAKSNDTPIETSNHTEVNTPAETQKPIEEEFMEFFGETKDIISGTRLLLMLKDAETVRFSKQGITVSIPSEALFPHEIRDKDRFEVSIEWQSKTEFAFYVELNGVPIDHIPNTLVMVPYRLQNETAKIILTDDQGISYTGSYDTNIFVATFTIGNTGHYTINEQLSAEIPPESKEPTSDESGNTPLVPLAVALPALGAGGWFLRKRFIRR